MNGLLQELRARSMTTPIERRQAIERTERFLCRLMDSNEIPLEPNDIRKEAYRCLKHYPDFSYMEEAAIESPRVWGPVQLDGLKITSMDFAKADEDEECD